MTEREILPLPSGAPKAGEVYRHHKGNMYKVSGVALHSDEKWVVVYEPMYECPYPFFTRPLSEWAEVVEWQGKKVPRFTKVV